MALQGTHIACGYVGSPPNGALLGAIQWSRTMAAPGVTDVAALNTDVSIPGIVASNLSFEVRAVADIWVAWGKAPDASQISGSGQSARLFVPANETRNILCQPGDKLAWALA